MKQWIKAVGAGSQEQRNLTYDEAVAAAHVMARGEATEAQAAAFLVALRMKKETSEEMTAFIDVFRKYTMPFASFSDSVSSVGLYEGRSSFHISLVVSLLLASVGVPQVLYGGDSAVSMNGTSLVELLDSFQIGMNVPNQVWEEMFAKLHIGMLRMDAACPPLRDLRSVRNQLGIETIVNAVEKFLNPVQSQTMVCGLKQRNLLTGYIETLARTGVQTTYLVQGIEGSEDLPIYKKSTLRKVTPYYDESIVFDPETFGFRGEPLEKRDRQEQVDILLEITKGEETPDLRLERDHVIFNTGLRLVWFDKVGSYEEGFQLARLLLHRKEAYKLLMRWSEYSGRKSNQGNRKAN